MTDWDTVCIFVGYPRDCNADCYQMWDPVTGSNHISCDIVWLCCMYYLATNHSLSLADDSLMIAWLDSQRLWPVITAGERVVDENTAPVEANAAAAPIPQVQVPVQLAPVNDECWTRYGCVIKKHNFLVLT